jgi:hypothetical protein
MEQYVDFLTFVQLRIALVQVILLAEVVAVALM